MAQQDKTDWYWNGVLAGAVNNLYYDLINVDVCHVPYATNHRNSSFFLKTRTWYQPEKNWDSALTGYIKDNWDIVDVHIIWDEKCNQTSWKLYLLAREKNWWKKRRIFTAPITDWCVWTFNDPTRHTFETTVSWCWDWKFLVTDYVRWEAIDSENALTYTSSQSTSWATWIQINKVTWWTTIWLFEDEDTVKWYAKRNQNKIERGMYLLVFASENKENSWFAWQVRMVTWFSSDWKSIEVDSPWLWFKVPNEWNSVRWWWLNYAFFSERWEVVGFTDWRDIQLITDYENDVITRPYTHSWTYDATNTNIIWVADAASKIFILTDNWYIHYNKDSWWYNKFFINDDMFAWVDKTSIAAYRDIILAFWRNHISVWVPDNSNAYWTMYNQSTTIWLRSRYSYAEYEWDLIFVSNDKRLLALGVANNVWRYMLQHEDVWDMVNWKLATLVEWDEVYIWNDKNDLRIFINIKPTPYKISEWSILPKDWNNTATRIYKFNTLFKVWTEDYIPHFLLWGCKFWIYYWQYWIYKKEWHIWYSKYEDVSADVFSQDARFAPVETNISAFLIENESDWVWWTSSWLSNRPKLYNLAKLNRLITTLWPWIYSNTSKILITEYTKWVWFTYEFPVSWDWNNWLAYMTDLYLWNNIDVEPEEWEENPFLCAIENKKDSQNLYKVKCSDSKLKSQYLVPESPWCDSNREFLYQDYKICVNDELYKIAPTMPLVTNLWENQDYATQIKIELIWWKGDVICFGWWLAEMFIAPLFTTGPDWEYQLQPNTECD